MSLSDENQVEEEKMSNSNGNDPNKNNNIMNEEAQPNTESLINHFNNINIGTSNPSIQNFHNTEINYNDFYPSTITSPNDQLNDYCKFEFNFIDFNEGEVDERVDSNYIMPDSNHCHKHSKK